MNLTAFHLLSSVRLGLSYSPIYYFAVAQSRFQRDPQSDDELNCISFVKFSQIGTELQPRINYQLTIANYQLRSKYTKIVARNQLALPYIYILLEMFD